MNLKEVTVQVPTQSNESRNSEERGFYSGVSSGFSSNIEENSRQSEQEETNRFGKKKSQIFLYHPVKKRSKGTSLLRHLENNKNISWNERGEIIYK